MKDIKRKSHVTSIVGVSALVLILISGAPVSADSSSQFSGIIRAENQKDSSFYAEVGRFVSSTSGEVETPNQEAVSYSLSINDSQGRLGIGELEIKEESTTLDVLSFQEDGELHATVASKLPEIYDREVMIHRVDAKAGVTFDLYILTGAPKELKVEITKESLRNTLTVSSTQISKNHWTVNFKASGAAMIASQQKMIDPLGKITITAK